MAYEIYPRVYFGSAGITWRPELIAPFTHIINCDSERSSTNMWARNGRQFLFLESDDADDYPILHCHLDRLIAYIDEALLDTNAHILIHCRMGINRSATLAVGYACSKLHKSANEIITDVRRNITEHRVLCNYGFIEQLHSRFP